SGEALAGPPRRASPGPGREKRLAHPLKPGPGLLLAPSESLGQLRQRNPALQHAAAVLEGAARGDAECLRRPESVLRSEDLLQLCRAPGEVLAFLSLAVGILGGVEGARGR